MSPAHKCRLTWKNRPAMISTADANVSVCRSRGDGGSATLVLVNIKKPMCPTALGQSMAPLENHSAMLKPNETSATEAMAAQTNRFEREDLGAMGSARIITPMGEPRRSAR